jgi:hypothetical protein
MKATYNLTPTPAYKSHSIYIQLDNHLQMRNGSDFCDGPARKKPKPKKQTRSNFIIYCTVTCNAAAAVTVTFK